MSMVWCKHLNSHEDRILIENLYVFKGYGAKVRNFWIKVGDWRNFEKSCKKLARWQAEAAALKAYRIPLIFLLCNIHIGLQTGYYKKGIGMVQMPLDYLAVHCWVCRAVVKPLSNNLVLVTVETDRETEMHWYIQWLVSYLCRAAQTTWGWRSTSWLHARSSEAAVGRPAWCSTTSCGTYADHVRAHWRWLFHSPTWFCTQQTRTSVSYTHLTLPTNREV